MFDVRPWKVYHTERPRWCTARCAAARRAGPSATADDCLSLKRLQTVALQGEVTSQNLWSRYDRHVVGITWNDV